MHGRLGLGAASLKYLSRGNAIIVLEYFTSSIIVFSFLLLLAVHGVKYFKWADLPGQLFYFSEMV